MNKISPYQIRSVKISVKVPKIFELDFVERRCQEKGAIFSVFPNFIVFSKVNTVKKLPDDFNPNTKFTFFKYRSRDKAKLSFSHHVNVAGIRTLKSIRPALAVLAELLQIRTSILRHTVDNIQASTKLPTSINKEVFIRANPKSFQQLERFPAIFLRSKSKSVVILVYGSGSCILSGARNIEQLEEGYRFLQSCFANYLNMKKLTTKNQDFKFVKNVV